MPPHEQGKAADGWGEYQKLVLSSLEGLKESQDRQEEKISASIDKLEARLRAVENELSALRMKSSFWGGLAGMGAYLGMFLLELVRKGFGGGK